MLFSNEIKRRLDKIEAHVQTQDDRDKEFRILAAEMVAGIRSMNDSLDRHMREENDEAKRNTNKLDQISAKLNDIERDLIAIPKDTDLKIQRNQEELREYISSHYATREDLTEGLNSIRSNAKTIWIVMSGVLACIAWTVSTIIDYVN